MPAARKWQLVLELQVGRFASFLSKKYYGVGTKVEALLPSKYLDLQVLVILPLLNVVFCLRLSAFIARMYSENSPSTSFLNILGDFYPWQSRLPEAP